MSAGDGGRLEASNLVRQVRENPRLRLGLYAVGIILLWYVILALGSQARAVHTQYFSAAEQYAGVLRVASQKQWPQRERRARVSLVHWQSLLWQANSPGLAQAEFQQWLIGLVPKSGAGSGIRAETRPAVAVPGQPGLWMVTGKVQAKFATQTLIDLLRQIQTHRPLVQITGLELRPGSLNRLRIELRAYFSATPAPGSAGAGGDGLMPGGALPSTRGRIPGRAGAHG